MAAADNAPVLVFDLAGYSSLISAQVTAAMDRLVAVLDEAVRPLFGPMADPWASLERWNTGDGYYVLLRGLGAHAGFWLARKIDERLAAGDAPDADDLIRLRMVLGWGAVARIGDRFEGRVLTEMGRLLDGPVLRQTLADSDGKTALAATPEFHGAWGQDGFRNDADWKIEPAEWFPYEDRGKRDEVWEGFLFGRPPAAPAAAHEPEPEPMPPEPVRIVAFVAHSLDEPLPAALEWAQVLANKVLGSSLNIELRLAPASRAEIVSELSNAPDLAFYYGHGDERGRLVLNDGPAALTDLQPELWRGLKGCILFACDSIRFAAELECPYVAFDQKIWQSAPVGFVEAVLECWPSGTLRAAVVEAFELCAQEMRSEFPDAGVLSAAPFGDLSVEPGAPVLVRGTPRQFGWVASDYGEIVDGRVTYPEHEPFVGRRRILTDLLQRISPFDDSARVQARWITGAGGVGKTALTRELVLTSADALFLDPDRPLWIAQMNCYAFTDAGAILREFAKRLSARHGIEEADDIERAAAGLSAHRGEHLWVLDDLTYLATKPDDTTAARRLVDTLTSAARRNGLLVRIVVTSRRGDGSFPGLEELGPLEWPAAAEMAQGMAWAADKPLVPADLEFGARRLHGMAQGMPALYKRSLKQALEAEGYRAHADAMAQSFGDSLEAMDLDELARRMTAYEIEALGGLEAEHGFAYRRFLGAAYDLFRHAGWFDIRELAAWFSEEPLAASDQAYKRGLRYLLRLGFLALERREDESVYVLPPNQRQVVQARRIEAGSPPDLPFRAPGQALSMALERVRNRDFGALGDFDELRRAYGGDLQSAEAAAAVVAAMNVEAEVRSMTLEDGTEQALGVYREILSIAESYEDSWSEENSALVIEHLAICLVNMGVMLGQQDRADEAIAVYERLASQYGDRPEAGIAEQVATGLIGLATAYWQSERLDEALEQLDKLEAILDARDEEWTAATGALAARVKEAILAARNGS